MLFVYICFAILYCIVLLYRIWRVVKGYYRATCLDFFLFHMFHNKRGVIHCISCQKSCCHIKFAKKKWKFENKATNKLETGMSPQGFCRKIYIVCLFDRNQNLLLCTPLVYMPRKH